MFVVVGDDGEFSFATTELRLWFGGRLGQQPGHRLAVTHDNHLLAWL
jgi:hypothetical protein